jgi:tetratricopeptide (TPR) repeat protein
MARLVQRLGLTRYEADEHYKKALQLFSQPQPKVDDAIIEMGYAIDLLPTNSEYYATRGYFYLMDSMLREAQADFEQSVKLYPHEMLANYGLGVLAYRERNWDDALERFKVADYVMPERAETLYYLGMVYHRKQDNPQALIYMRQAEALFDAHGDAKQKKLASTWVREIEKLAKKQLPPQLPR